MFRSFFHRFGRRFYSTETNRQKDWTDFITTPKLIPFGSALALYSVYNNKRENKTVCQYIEAGVSGAFAGWIFPIVATFLVFAVIGDELGCRDNGNYNANKQIKASNEEKEYGGSKIQDP